MSDTDYFKMYLEKVKEIGFSESHIPGIIRYLMVNGHIPVTEEHLTLMGDTQFHISAKHLPSYIKKGLIEHYEKDPWAGDYEEEVEIDHINTVEYHLDSAWIKGGEVVDFKMNVTRIIKVQTEYHFREARPEDPHVTYYDCFRDMAPDERVQQHWEKSNICPHCDYKAEESEGYSELYDDGSCRIVFSGDGRDGTCCGKAFYVLHPDYTQPSDYVCEDCGNATGKDYHRLEDGDTILCIPCWNKVKDK